MKAIAENRRIAVDLASPDRVDESCFLFVRLYPGQAMMCGRKTVESRVVEPKQLCGGSNDHPA